MRICHVSDSHGWLQPLPDPSMYDVIVHSGDLCPNKSFGIKPIEEFYQTFWLENNISKLSSWIGNKPFLFCPGNHDYINPVPYMKSNDIDAYWLADEFIELAGIGFYGFPWTPEFCGWNWMCGPTEQQLRLNPAIDLMNEGKIDVFISHGPMYGVLDRNAHGDRCGSLVLRDAMQSVKMPPKYLMQGHIHEAEGLQGWSRGMIISNAAQTSRILEVR